MEFMLLVSVYWMDGSRQKRTKSIIRNGHFQW